MILQTLVETHAPTVRGAILCDHEGERIEAYSADMSRFDLDVAGASFATPTFGLEDGTRLRLIVDDTVYWILMVSQGCYLVVCCRRGEDLACRADFAGVAEALTAYI